MQKRQARTDILFAIIAGSLIVAFSALSPGAQAQQPAPALPEGGKTPPSSTPPPSSVNPVKPSSVNQDEPIAITEKSKLAAATVPVKVMAEDRFGNFRYPVINNKGEVAFLGIFNSPKSKRGYGQSVFIRSVDGKWRVIPEGEKATNLPEPIYGMVLPAFNNNSDLTFIASYGSETGKTAPPLDLNDPLAQTAPVKKQGLFIRSAAGLRSLVKLGEEVPNMPSSFSMISNPTTNSKNTTAFIGTYTDPDGRGLFFIEDGKLHLIVRSGQKLSSTEGITFSEHYYPSPINERNEVAFLARVSDKVGIFVGRKSGLETIAMTGRPSPIEGADYIGFGNRAPAINDQGQVVHAAFYGGLEPGRGLFLKNSMLGGVPRLPGGVPRPGKELDEATIIARSGQPIPGTTYSFTDFFAPAINSRGDVVFIGGFGGRNRGIFIKTAKGIEPIALVDQPVPADSANGGGASKDEVFTNFTQPVINDNGVVVFYAGSRSSTDGVTVGIYLRNEKGELRAIARRGDKMPK